MAAAEPGARFAGALEALGALSETSTVVRVRGGPRLLGGPSVPLSPSLDDYQRGRGEWALPLPKSARRAFRSKTTPLAITDESLRVNRGKAAVTLAWNELVRGRVRFGREEPSDLLIRLETLTTSVDLRVLLPEDGASALVGAIWERLRHRPGLEPRRERLRQSRALGVQIPSDIWEEGDKAIVTRGGEFRLRCELSRDPQGPKWQLSAQVVVPVHVHLFFASGGRRASRASAIERFLDDLATRAAWLLLTRSPPDPLLRSDVQICGECLTWNARAVSQPHSVETFELAIAVLAWRMMSFSPE